MTNKTPARPCVALSPYSDELAEGMAALGIEPTAERLSRLLAFGELLLKWNRAYNLTAIREPKEIITRHLLDSLTVWPWAKSLRTLADIGSGAGFPGIPLAIVCPSLTVHSIEAVGKKAGFQQQAKIELWLNNLNVMQRRAETVRPAELPDGGVEAVISRAFSSLADFVRLAGGLVAENGALYAMKGAPSEAEIAALPAGWRIEARHCLSIPNCGDARHLLVVRRSLLA
ncbi:MAG: 16S rRNA (guanine(527)-N(7))-methyltransferase RsmG [Azoarcus sp.]|nr:16S rRNA (guanine(527)-N(7))-methyltransferase RsmG [Azoarcus sp.]